MMENFFKKSPGKKIEDLEGQIKAERMKLMSNEEKIKAQLEEAGGIEGLNKSIEKKNPVGKGVVGGITAVTGAALLYALSADRSLHIESPEQVMEVLRHFILYTVGTGGVAMTAFGSIAGVGGGIKDWWEKKKLESLKGEAESLEATA